MNEFITAIETDAEFNEEIHALLGDGKIAKIVEAAAKKGFAITEAALQEHLESRVKELPEEALENIAGGAAESDGSMSSPHTSESCWFIKKPGSVSLNGCFRLSCKAKCHGASGYMWYQCNCWGTPRCTWNKHHTDEACR